MGGTGGAGGAAGQSGAATSTTTTTRSTTVNFVPSQGPNEVRVSTLRGMAVRNAQNEDLGDINDIVMDSSNGNPKAVIIGVGGFLGLGEKNVAVPFNALTFTQGNDGTRVARLDTTKDALQNAPTYAFADSKTTAPRTQ
jgi:sporulation protein YlmC with PRC-barrel domain